MKKNLGASSRYWDAGKSINAQRAESDGRYPATEFKKRYGIDPRKLIKSIEWHHSSKFFNKVDYYDIDDVFEAMWDLPIEERKKYLKNKIFNDVWQIHKKELAERNLKNNLNPKSDQAKAYQGKKKKEDIARIFIKKLRDKYFPEFDTIIRLKPFLISQYELAIDLSYEILNKENNHKKPLKFQPPMYELGKIIYDYMTENKKSKTNAREYFSENKHLIQHILDKPLNGLTMILTTKNYYEFVKDVDFHSLPKGFQKMHELINESTENGKDWSLYDEDKEAMETLQLYFDKIDHYMNSQKVKKEVKKEVEKESKPAKITKQKPAYINTKKPVADHGDFVEAVSLEVKYIKRYVNLNGKTHEKKSIYNLLTALQKDILSKKIRKTSEYAKEIAEIQINLVKVYNAMGASIKINIDSKKLTHLLDIAGSEKQMLSIALIKRFLNLYRKPEKAKAEKLLSDIDKALKSGAVPQNCIYIKEIHFVEKSLTDYLLSGSIEIETYQLHGLMGCCEMKTLSGVDSSDCVNSMELQQMNFNSIGLSGELGSLIGDPTEPFSMMIFGGPGSGKSTLAIKMAFELAAKYNKPIAYVAKEEGTGATLKEKFQRLNAFHPNIDLYTTMPKDVKKYKYIFVDSANEMKMNCETLKNLIDKYHPEAISFVFVFKGTKDGSFRGTLDNEHLVDVSVKCNNGTASTEKSRFGGRMTEKEGFRIY